MCTVRMGTVHVRYALDTDVKQSPLLVKKTKSVRRSDQEVIGALGGMRGSYQIWEPASCAVTV